MGTGSLRKATPAYASYPPRRAESRECGRRRPRPPERSDGGWKLRQKQARPLPIPLKIAITIMLTFKLLNISNVDLLGNLLTSVLTFKLLVINDVDLVDIYMRICPLA